MMSDQLAESDSMTRPTRRTRQTGAWQPGDTAGIIEVGFQVEVDSESQAPLAVAGYGPSASTLSGSESAAHTVPVPPTSAAGNPSPLACPGQCRRHAPRIAVVAVAIVALVVAILACTTERVREALLAVTPGTGS